MNGTNLHETGVRQMGRAEGGGRGGERQGRGRVGVVVEEEEEGEGETDTGLMCVKGRLWRGVEAGWDPASILTNANCKQWHIW